MNGPQVTTGAGRKAHNGRQEQEGRHATDGKSRSKMRDGRPEQGAKHAAADQPSKRARDGRQNQLTSPAGGRTTDGRTSRPAQQEGARRAAGPAQQEGVRRTAGPAPARRRVTDGWSSPTRGRA